MLPTTHPAHEAKDGFKVADSEKLRDTDKSGKQPSEWLKDFFTDFIVLYYSFTQ